MNTLWFTEIMVTGGPLEPLPAVTGRRQMFVAFSLRNVVSSWELPRNEALPFLSGQRGARYIFSRLSGSFGGPRLLFLSGFLKVRVEHQLLD